MNPQSRSRILIIDGDRAMSEGEESLPHELLQSELEPLRQELARLLPTTKSGYEAMVTEFEGQLQWDLREPSLAGQLRDEIAAIWKCVTFDLEVGQSGVARKRPKKHTPDPVETKSRYVGGGSVRGRG